MEKKDISLLLSENSYPGRGIILGLGKDGNRSVAAYFIMGKSENTRNRIFERTSDGIRTKAFDTSTMPDPSLFVYNPVRFVNGFLIVTNGDQTDTIRDYLLEGRTFRDALLTREFEPDSPIFTPRISGILYPRGIYKLSILKSAGGISDCCCRYFYEYSKPIAGTGHLISTYKHDGNPRPSFEGEPICVEIDCGYREFADRVWESMDKDNKVALYVCEIDRVTGKYESVIINKL